MIIRFGSGSGQPGLLNDDARRAKPSARVNACGPMLFVRTAGPSKVMTAGALPDRRMGP